MGGPLPLLAPGPVLFRGAGEIGGEMGSVISAPSLLDWGCFPETWEDPWVGFRQSDIRSGSLED